MAIMVEFSSMNYTHSVNQKVSGVHEGKSVAIGHGPCK